MGIDSTRNRNSLRIGLAEQLNAKYNQTIEPKVDKHVEIQEDRRDDKNHPHHKRHEPPKLPDIH